MRYVLIGLLALSVAANLWLVLRKPTSHIPNPWIARDLERRGRTDVFAAAPSTQEAVMFAGDSIVERCPWTEYLGVPTLNRGVDGDTTAGFVARQTELRRHHPVIAFILIGVNDLAKGGSPEEVTQGLKDVAHLGLAPRCFMFGLLNCSGGQARLNPAISQVNKVLKIHAKDWGVTYIEPPKSYDPTSMTYDGVHPNGRGYQALSGVIKPFLARE